MDSSRCKDELENVAHRLELPTSNCVHPIVHVSLLKKKIGNNTPIMPIPLAFDESLLEGQRQLEVISTI